jgi:hypothetical protein
MDKKLVWGYNQTMLAKKSVTKKKVAAAKKTARRAVPKKSAAAKAAGQKQRTLKKASRPRKQKPVKALKEQCFWFHDGSVADDIISLCDVLNGIPNDVFAYHVNSGKNDIVNWVRDVLLDHDLALELENYKSRSGTRKVVAIHIEKYYLTS